MMRQPLRRAFVFLALASLSACFDDCDVTNAGAVGGLEPPLLDLGPVPLGTECRATLQVTNSGTADLTVDGSELVDSSGDFVIGVVPATVALGGSDELIVNYTAGGAVDERQSVTVRLATNGRYDDGVLQSTITALPTDETAGVAVARCGEGEERGACEELAFGAVQVNTPGLPASGRRNLQVDIVNDGNAPLVVSAAVIDGGDGDFQREAVLFGNVQTTLPATLAPGRSGACEPPGESTCLTAEDCNVLTIDMVYTPTALGGDAATLVVLTDAAEGAELSVALSGAGSDVGLAITPNVVNFVGVGEGQSETAEIRVANIGTNDAPVNDTCIDVGGDGECDGYCTGGDDDKVENGTLGCDVTKADGETNEGKGFRLGPTDAQAGGDDERVIFVTWAPIAGNPAIPPGTTLRLETAILSNKVYTVPLGGGGAGVLEVDAAPSAVCGSGLCLDATSATPEEENTWTGSLDFTLVNSGDATLDITAFAFDANDQPTIEDDFALLDAAGDAVTMSAPGITLAPDASVDLTVAYANNDASQVDLVNLVVTHTGLGAELVIPVGVRPPQ